MILMMIHHFREPQLTKVAKISSQSSKVGMKQQCKNDKNVEKEKKKTKNRLETIWLKIKVSGDIIADFIIPETRNLFTIADCQLSVNAPWISAQFYLFIHFQIHYRVLEIKCCIFIFRIFYSLFFQINYRCKRHANAGNNNSPKQKQKFQRNLTA